MAIMFTTHNLGVVAQMTRDVMSCLGKVVESGNVDAILRCCYSHTQALLRSIPRWAQSRQRLGRSPATCPIPTTSRRAARSIPLHPGHPACALQDAPLITVSDGHQARCHLYN